MSNKFIKVIQIAGNTDVEMYIRKSNIYTVFGFSEKTYIGVIGSDEGIPVRESIDCILNQLEESDV